MKKFGSREFVERARIILGDLQKLARGQAIDSRQRKRLVVEMRQVAQEFTSALHQLDPVAQPQAVFDPGNPRTIGFFVAVALTAQPKTPLGQVGDFYGSGIYAIYYDGPFKQYAPIRGSETPIYVGQAAPVKHARSGLPIDQGRQLAKRLAEHRKNIERAHTTLKADDFFYRALVVSTGWETGAEDFLIQLFRPIWNKETNLVFGIGKHGDSASTRGNKRSPWDTLHLGREWAVDTKEDAKTLAQITSELRDHFASHAAFRKLDDVMSAFLTSLRQH